MKHAWIVAAALCVAAPAAARGGRDGASPPPIDDTGGAAMLGKAQKAIDDIDYETAKAATDEALASGTLDRGELARAHMLAGEVAAALGDDAGAHDHFERWILLAPDAKLPDGLSPKITQPFTAAHASADALGAARFDVDASRARGKVAITVAGDPLHMVARVHLAFDHGGDREGVSAEFEVPVDDAATQATITLADEYGNTLAERTVTFGGTTATAAIESHAPETTHTIPGPLRWPTWAVLTAVAAGSCGYFAHARSQDEQDLAALNASSGTHSFDEAKAIEDRGNRDTLLTNVSLGVAIAALAATVVTVAVDHEVEVQPIAAPGAAGASVSLHF